MQNADIASNSDRGGGQDFSGNIPVLFLVWIRPELTKKVFSQIRKAKPKRLYVAIDGPRNDDDKKLIEKTLEVITVDWDCEVKYLKRDKNLGCKVAVSEALTWFFEQEEMGIVLEDDCYPDLSFFPYCEELLIKYKDDTRIGSISGYGNNIPNSKYSYDFSKHFGCWGWASWRRAWKYFDINMSDFDLFLEENAIEKFIIDEWQKYTLLDMFKRHASHNETSWGWIFTYCLYCQNALIIYPNTNMIENIGINVDNSAHRADDGLTTFKLSKMHFPMKHPHFIGVYNSWNKHNYTKFFLIKTFRLLSNLMPTKGLRHKVRYFIK